MLKTAPNYISDGLHFVLTIINLEVALQLVLSNFKSAYLHHSFTYSAAKIWNNLPDAIRQSKTLSSFKNQLQNITMNKGGKFPKKVWCCVGGEYYKIIWFYQVS